MTAAGTDKSMVGGDGTLSNITIGGDAGEFTAVSPGQGISSSLSSKLPISKFHWGMEVLRIMPWVI